jgi:hypothetical protein
MLKRWKENQMKLNKISEDIHIYDDFLTPEESEKTLNMILAYAERDPDYWKPISFYESYSAGYPEDNDPILEQFGLPSNWMSTMMTRYREAAANVAGVSPEKMSRISFHVQRWLPGAFAPLHSDNSDNNGVMGAFTRSRYAGFMYLNSDFEGGLLKFKANYGEQDISIQPKAGMFAIFHGGHKNMHEVSVIKHGARYTLGSFWDDREESDYPADIREKWAKELAEVRAMQKDQQKDWADIRESGYRISPEGNKYLAEEVE